MHDEPAFCNLIYEYFVLRFKFQNYKYGDQLPSIDTLCHKFCVAPLTVKAALRRLQEEGYVSIRHGKCTQVTFQQSEDEYQKFKGDFFADRIHLYADFSKAMDLIFLPLYVEGFQHMDEKDLADLCQIVERWESDSLVNFYSSILQKMKNPLALNLFWETALFLGFPSLTQDEISGFYHAESFNNRLYRLIDSGREKKSSLICEAHNAFVQDITDKFIGLWNQQIETGAPVISFRWRIYRNRPQICYNLATLILHHIYFGEYSEADFLPSYQTMAEKYDVSLSTIRRTIHILNEVGAVHSINGKGTCILSSDQEGYEANLTNSAIRQNLAYFIQAFELLKFSIEGVSRTTLPALPLEVKEDLIRQLEKLLQEHRCQLASNEVLVYIYTYSPLKDLREIYEKLYKLMLWGLPLIRHRTEASGIDKMLIQFTEALISALKKGNFDDCTELLRELFTTQYSIAEAYLYRQGLKPEELRLPSFKLMLANQ